MSSLLRTFLGRLNRNSQDRGRPHPPSTPTRESPAAKRLDTKKSPARPLPIDLFPEVSEDGEDPLKKISSPAGVGDMSALASAISTIEKSNLSTPSNGNLPQPLAPTQPSSVPPPSLLSTVSTEALPTGNELVRSLSEVLAERQLLEAKFTVPASFPDYVWPTFEDALDAVKAFCKDLKNNGGGFAVIKDTTRTVATKRAKKGERKLIRCACHGKSKVKIDETAMVRPNQVSIKTGCKWGFWVEKTSEGWIRSCFNDFTRENGFQESHNHKLAETQEQLSVYPSLRSIPEDLLNIAKTWHMGGMKASMIYRKLCSHAADQSREISFNVKDIENLFRSDLVNRPLDCTDLYHYLLKRVADDTRLKFNIDINSKGELDKIFFVVNKGAYDVWQETQGSVILFGPCQQP